MRFTVNPMYPNVMYQLSTFDNNFHNNGTAGTVCSSRTELITNQQRCERWLVSGSPQMFSEEGMDSAV